MKATLTIQRGAFGEIPRVESFDVGFESGQSVLDGHGAGEIHNH